MQIFPDPAAAGFAITTEQILEGSAKEVGIGSEMAELVVGTRYGVRHPFLNLQPAIAMETVAFHKCGADLLTAEYLLERLTHRRRPGTGGAGHGNDWMTGRHSKLPPRFTHGSS